MKVVINSIKHVEKVAQESELEPSQASVPSPETRDPVSQPCPPGRDYPSIKPSAHNALSIPPQLLYAKMAPGDSKGNFEIQIWPASKLISTIAASDDESTIKVAPTKTAKDNSTSAKAGASAGGTIKLKRPAPKHNKPGNWRDGSVVDGEFARGANQGRGTEAGC
jgi:hypothetical protein